MPKRLYVILIFHVTIHLLKFIKGISCYYFCICLKVNCLTVCTGLYYMKISYPDDAGDKVGVEKCSMDVVAFMKIMP